MTGAAPRFVLETLGGLRLVGTNRERTGTSRKPLALLAITAVAGSRGISRHRLTSLLWPQLTTARSSHVLSQTLYSIRRELGSEEVLTGGQTLILNRSLLGFDVADFRELVRGGDFEAAANMYGGPFLEGVSFKDGEAFERWLSPIRAGIAAEHARLLARLVDQAVDAGNIEAARRWFESGASLYPSDPAFARARRNTPGGPATPNAHARPVERTGQMPSNPSAGANPGKSENHDEPGRKPVATRGGDDQRVRSRSRRRAWRRRFVAGFGVRIALASTIVAAIALGLVTTRRALLSEQQQRYGGPMDERGNPSDPPAP